MRRYDKGERRYKHVGRGPNPEIAFKRDNPREWVGKCPSTLTPQDQVRLVNEAIAGNNGDREINFPKKLYVVHEGAIYEAQTSDRGKSYHGYPFRGKMGRQLLADLKEMATAKDCLRQFERWVEQHIEVHGT